MPPWPALQETTGVPEDPGEELPGGAQAAGEPGTSQEPFWEQNQLSRSETIGWAVMGLPKGGSLRGL